MKTLFEATLPFFPGYYCSILDTYIDSEIEMYLEDEDNDYETYESIEGQLDYNKAKLAMNQAWVDRFNVETGLNLKYKDMSSPKEYNFQTDRVFVEITLKELEKVRKITEEHPEEFQQYLTRNFKSGDGFVSFYPDDFEEWDKDTQDLDHNEAMTYIAVASTIDKDENELVTDITDHHSICEAVKSSLGLMY
jgi:hypothetical protein